MLVLVNARFQFMLLVLHAGTPCQDSMYSLVGFGTNGGCLLIGCILVFFGDVLS